MRLLIHDLAPEEAERVLPPLTEGDLVYGNDNTLRNCIGCMRCMTRQDGKCVLSDGFSDVLGSLGELTELVIISECLYGGLSPFAKNAVDRLIPVFQNGMELRGEGTCFKNDRPETADLMVYLYGSATRREMLTARRYVERLAISWEFREAEVYFYDSVQELEGSVG